MSKINELYAEIDDWNNKIENEHRNFLKRKILNKKKIDELEDEKRRAGFHHDPLRVQQCNSQILQLKHDMKADYVYEFKSKIKICKIKIYDLIVEYYKNGHMIDEIIEIENIPKSITDEWFKLSNFGKNTGYLFIDELKDNEYNWKYCNPIKEIELYSKRLDDLKSEIEDAGELVLIFDSDLVNKIRNKELKFYQSAIDKEIEKLNDSHFSQLREIFKNLIEYADKFSDNQILTVYNFLIKDINHYEFFDDFNYILKANKDNFDNAFFDEIYEGIIDYGIKKLPDLDIWDLRDLFYCLKECASKFNKNQITDFYKFICDNVENYEHFSKLDYILSVNEDKLDEDFIEDIHIGLMDNALNKFDSENWDMEYVFNYFKDYADKFSYNQINRLFNILISNESNFKYCIPFKHILEVNEEKIAKDSLEKINGDIIDSGINCLENSDSINGIFEFLSVYSDNFSLIQLNKVCAFVIQNIDLYGFAKEFRNILRTNESKFENSFEDIYVKFIDGKINLLSNIDTVNNVSEDVLKDLRYFSDKFSENQFEKLCDIIVDNAYICNFTNHFDYISKKNKGISDEIYSKIIDNRIQKLKNSSLQDISPDLFSDLNNYSIKFNQNQLNSFCEIVFNEKDVYSNVNAILGVVFTNKDKVDGKYIDKISSIKINAKLNELDRLGWGYTRAREILNYLDYYSEQFNESQINKLCEIAIRNSQVYNCIYCKPALRSILNKNKDIVDENLYKEAILMNNLQLD